MLQVVYVTFQTQKHTYLSVVNIGLTSVEKVVANFPNKHKNIYRRVLQEELTQE